jgi:hypothetical protein
MGIVLAAVLGATIALGVRELVEHRERRAEKIRNCHHVFVKVEGPTGYYTNFCRKCPYQEPADKEAI